MNASAYSSRQSSSRQSRRSIKRRSNIPKKHVDIILSEDLIEILDKDIYFISELPSHVVASDVVGIVLVAFILSLLATIYPSYKASQMKPAEALRYE